MSSKSHSLLAAAMGMQHHAHHARISPSPSSSTAVFTIVQLTETLLPLLEPVEAASYPASYCEGVPGYAKRLHAKPACPSFVCLQRTSGGQEHAGVAALAAAGDVAHLRAIGYAITCRMPRRTASLLLRDESENKEPKKPHNSDDDSAEVESNQAVRPVTKAQDHLPPPPSANHADTLYVHDVAVHPDFRGLGVAGALWRQIEQTRVELQLKRMALVAVFGASSYWARHGFREVARKALPQDTVRVLDDYGDHAVFMERED